MESQTNQPYNLPQPQQQVPNSTAVLVLGIISIIGCFCYGVIGVICAIIAIVLAGNGKKLYDENKALYTEGSYNNLKAGKICAIIGLVLSIIYILIIIFAFAFIGIEGLRHPESIFRNMQ